jgi:hypothetical protein
MLQIMGAANGGVYDLTIEYQCRTPDGAAFDYLAGVSDETDDVALTTAPAPARRDDASILLPDEPSIDADVPARRFRAWGASFEGPAEGPLPAGDCESTRQITVSLHAQGTVPVLMWGGHLASDEDWGEGQGASSQPDPISMRVSVNGSETKTLTVAPDAIGP